jgi:hypothetical protein
VADWNARRHRRLGASDLRNTRIRRTTVDGRRGSGYNRSAAGQQELASETVSNPEHNLARRWTVIASGLLLSALALVVLYTGHAAFHSPSAVVVVSAIGMAALLFQLRLQDRTQRPVAASIWLNAAGVICSALTLFADRLHLSDAALQVAALIAVGCFAVSGVLILSTLRKDRA